MVDAAIRASIDDEHPPPVPAAPDNFSDASAFYAFLTFFAFIYILPLFCRHRQFVSRIAGFLRNLVSSVSRKAFP